MCLLSPFADLFVFVHLDFLNLILPSSSFQGAKAVAEMLKKNSSLRVLELNNNMIDYSVSY